ncbi:hypothetical protein C8J57DRAFT_1487665 [Mycena rebaudengoi]|nr:hypothetical protein C8J57DRAFT_1487665 [Mycena rebaudengoi]
MKMAMRRLRALIMPPVLVLLASRLSRRHSARRKMTISKCLVWRRCLTPMTRTVKMRTLIMTRLRTCSPRKRFQPAAAPHRSHTLVESLLARSESNPESLQLRRRPRNQLVQLLRSSSKTRFISSTRLSTKMRWEPRVNRATSTINVAMEIAR